MRGLTLSLSWLPKISIIPRCYIVAFLCRHKNAGVKRVLFFGHGRNEGEDCSRHRSLSVCEHYNSSAGDAELIMPTINFPMPHSPYKKNSSSNPTFLGDEFGCLLRIELHSFQLSSKEKWLSHVLYPSFGATIVHIFTLVLYCVLTLAAVGDSALAKQGLHLCITPSSFPPPPSPPAR